MSENDSISQLAREKYERIAKARKRLTDILDAEFPGGYALVISHYTDPDKAEGSWNWRLPGVTDVGAPSPAALDAASAIVRSLVFHATDLRDEVLRMAVTRYGEEREAYAREIARSRGLMALLEEINQELVKVRTEDLALQAQVEKLEKKARKKPRKAKPKKKRGRKK